MDRRQFCRAAGTALAGLGLGLAADKATASGAAARDTGGVDGLVSTRGHYAEHDDAAELTDGHTSSDYDIEGTIPGYTTDDSPEEIVVGVHGVIDSSDAESKFDEVATNLRGAGYEGPVVGFTYDSASSFWDAVTSAWSETDTKREIARRNRRKLGAFLREYARRSPETTVHLVGHSGGGFVTLETVKFLHDEGWEGRLDSVILLAAAVDDETAALGGRYGPALEARAREVDSFHDPDDWVMTWGWNILHFDQSLGANPVQGTPPDNYEDHAVDDIDGHGAYFLPRAEGGAVEDIVAEF